MSYTLDQLLDATGVSEISGGRFTKKASPSESFDLSKLAERCRRAVESTPEQASASSQKELVEKTAAVAVIGNVLAEIREIEAGHQVTTKVASDSGNQDQSLFINAALEAGHPPHAIAEFLEKNAGIFSRLGRRLSAGRASRNYNRFLKAESRAAGKGTKNLREWQNIIRRSESASPAEKVKLLNRMRKDLGDDTALSAFSSMGNHGFKDMKEYKDLQKAVPSAAAKAGQTIGENGKPLAASMNVGGHTIGLTSKQLNSAKKPALYAGAGYMGARALSGGGEKRKKGAPIIINS